MIFIIKLGNNFMNSIYRKIDDISIAALDVCLFEGNKYLITRINIPYKHRKNGIATSMLQELCIEADKSQKNLCLYIMSSGEMTNSQLAKWYRKFGFCGYGGFMKRNFKKIDNFT
jgi:predicted GNAT family acetyltransferase